MTIASPSAQSNQTGASPRPPSSRKTYLSRCASRRAAIVAEVERTGVKGAVSKFGITRQRVSAVLKREGKSTVKFLPPPRKS